MSEAADTQPRPAPKRDAAADKHALAQVEKWLDMIREIGHERQGQAKLYG
jgi:hypothetical protein